MAFTSVAFALFLALSAIIYFLTPKRYRWVTLFVANYVFYFFAGGGYFLYLLLTTFSTYFATILIGKMAKKNQYDYEHKKEQLDKAGKKAWKAKFIKRKRLVLIPTLFFNFGILGVLKYYGFLSLNINLLFEMLSFNARLPIHSFLLPLGISFYTFQSMGYLIDVYREKYQPEQNFAKLALFISFFPQIVQGPIGRFQSLSEQLFRSNKFSYERIKFGIQLILWGAFKKLVVADRAKVLVDTVFENTADFGGFYVLFAALTYCIQLYGDFSGGIDIATGAAQIFGIELDKNFERPYLAKSIPDFWRRWHISLGTWFRDYVFYPLSLSKFFMKVGKGGRAIFGNYVGKLLPVLIPQFIIFFLIGIWHGAEWKYIVFGLYNGTLIVLGILFDQPLQKMAKVFKIRMDCFSWKLFQILRTLFLVAMGKIITRAPVMEDAVFMFQSMIDNWSIEDVFNRGFLELGLDMKDLQILMLSTVAWLTISLMQESGIKIREALSKQNILFRWLVYVIGIFVLILFGAYGLEYDAADFIYRGF